MFDDLFARRRAGVLLHPTSLPGPGATGGLGNEARRFVDFLHDGGFTVWQTLPLGPTDVLGSPYCLQSAYAGNPNLIDEWQLADCAELPTGFECEAVHQSPTAAYRSFAANATIEQRQQFAEFVARNRRWLLPYGLFRTCQQRFGGEAWWQWPPPFRDPSPLTLRTCLATSRLEFRSVAFEQYLFDIQWSTLKRYANGRGVAMFGDLPFYMDRNSVEVWWNRDLFRLDSEGVPDAVAGVPPDYFSAEGQLWGNPLYRWDRIEQQEFDWWINRFEGQLRRFDLIRIDHFRALESFWEVPAGAATARDGQWCPGYGDPLLEQLKRRLGALPLVAEDLGVITDEVRWLRDRYGLPGMAVLQFAFDGSSANPHLPANHRVHAVVYTGTHDNNTTVGWFGDLGQTTRDYVCEVLGCAESEVPGSMVEAAYASRAQLAVIPLQDLVEVGGEGRMNTPGTIEGNWGWRFDWAQLDPRIARLACERARRHSRLIDR